MGNVSGEACGFYIKCRQCACNVTLRRVRETILVVESNRYFIFLCVRVRACVEVVGSVGECMRVRAWSLAYAACKVYAPCCDVIRDPSVSAIFFDIIL